ncbi:MAG TPA: hypothetical protein VME43_13990 [Bryobacteraceae bacterium]|nr:hypothetical protein [Bryobacteraceae bacterium]
MATRTLWTAVAVGLVVAAALPAGLKEVLAEPNLDKRSKLALENADAAYQAARSAYDSGDNKAATADLHEVQESVELAYAALEATGKDPRKNPKWFKKAEMETRDLLRRLESFQEAMSFYDRASVDPVKAKVQQVHDELLMGLMEGKHK